MSFQDHVVPPVYSSQTAVEVHLDIQKYSRKTFDVDAVQIMEENLADIALWCEGKLDVSDAADPVVIIETKDKTNKKPDRILQGGVGDWILKIPTTGKNKFAWAIYKAYAFQRAFDKSLAESDKEGKFVNGVLETTNNIFLEQSVDDLTKIVVNHHITKEMTVDEIIDEITVTQLRMVHLKRLLRDNLNSDTAVSKT